MRVERRNASRSSAGAPTTAPDVPTKHRRRRRWLIVAACILVVVVAASVFLALRWTHRGPDEASVRSAVDRFRSSSTVPTPVTPLQPPAGVYTYAGEGTERLSFLSTEQSQGPTLPATVTYANDGCWTFAIEYNTFHQQTWEWCPRDAQLIERGGTTHQQFDFAAFKVNETSRVECDPPFVMVDPEADAGTTLNTRCRGHSETTGSDVVSEGTVSFVGRETLRVGDRGVATLHYLAERTLSGDQTGNERTEFWFSVDNGLPVRNERDITVVSPAPSPLNSVTYTERGIWELAALTPQT